MSVSFPSFPTELEHSTLLCLATSLGVLRTDLVSFVAFWEGSAPLLRWEELRRFSAIFGNVPFSTCSVICDISLSVDVCVCMVADEW